MATWEDGPEYAPLERPSDFALPDARPLEIAPRVQQQAALAPRDRPVFADPPVPVAPLATLIPVAEDVRDPNLPFDVASATITNDSAWGALHWSPPSGLPASPAASPWPANAPQGAPGPTGPPPPGSWPAPVQAAAPNSSPSAPGSMDYPPANYPAAPNFPAPDFPPPNYPAPGTPDYLGSAPRTGTGPDGPVTFQRVVTAATPGLLICLVVGGIIPIIAPVLLGVAFGLSSRASVAKQQLKRGFTIAVSFVGLIAVIGAMTNQTGFGDWWGFVGRWSLAACWAMAVAVVVLTYRALKNHDGPDQPSPRRATWG